MNEYLQERRVASFLPSSTEILYELELADQIVGVTHKCNYPEDAKTKPKLINSSFNTVILQSIDIDKKIVEMMKTGQDIYVIDDDKLKKSRPDIIIAQGIYTVGHWIPQMVTIAGGINGISSRGKPSRRMSMDEIKLFDPDKIVLMPGGFDLNRTLREARILDKNYRWKSLQAVQNNEVYAVNANAYFSKPGPRTIVGLEILAKIINPKLFEDLYVPSNSYCIKH